MKSFSAEAARSRAGECRPPSRGPPLRLGGGPRGNRRRRPLPRYIALALRGVLALRLFVFLVVIDFDDVFDYGPGRFATMFSALLYQHSHDNFRVATRRVANKPGIIFEFFLFPHPRASCVTDHLRA